MMEQEFPQTPLAGQTVPITIKRTRPAPSTGYPRYGTLPGNRGPSHSQSQNTSIQRGATLQHPPKKKTVTIGTFQTMDTSSGSAVWRQKTRYSRVPNNENNDIIDTDLYNLWTYQNLAFENFFKK